MKNLLLLLPLLVVSLGLSSCCSMFGRPSVLAGTHEETYQKRLCGYDTIQEEVLIDAKSGLTEIRETKVPRYETAVKKKRVPCQRCTRYYCPKSGCCGSGSDSAIKMATAQGPSGSPFIGLIPTMKPIAP